MSLSLETPTRSGLIPLIGMYGKSGSGKTHSALLLARGLAGAKGKIAIVDTEHKRSGALVGLIPGGFERINLAPPYSPTRYVEAIRLMETSGIACGVIDSATHEWHGDGGVLDMQETELQRMAGSDYGKREKMKMAAWIAPKREHNLFMDAILACKIPLICCLRGKEKTHILKDERGRMEIYTDTNTSPVSDKDFIFEMLVNMETVQHEDKPGCVRVTKYTHAGLLACLPKTGEQIAVRHGEALRHWLNDAGLVSPAAGAPAPSVSASDAPRLKALKLELWKALVSIHGGDKQKLQQFLWDEMLMDPSEVIEDCSEKQITAIIANAKLKLAKLQPTTP